MRGAARCLILGTAMALLVAGCATAPPGYTVAPDGAKEFVLTMRTGAFWPSYLVVNQGDRVRLVIHSYYQFAIFYFNKFGISRMVAHDAPEMVEFVATERGWFDFNGYGFYSYSASLFMTSSSVGGNAGSEHALYGRLYVQ